MTERITSDEPITQVAITDLADMLDPARNGNGGRRMALPGFDPEFVDFPDYIIRITHWIWHATEGENGEAAPRDVELCRRYYAEDCLVHTLLGDIHGVQAVVDGTYSHLQTFPDRVLDADNVIWSDDGVQDDRWNKTGNPTFYSSHRITSRMTHMGNTELPPATGLPVHVRTIADCACRDNVIFEEWIVRDYSNIALELGRDPDAIARAEAEKDIETGLDLVAIHADNRAATATGANMGAKVETTLPDSPEDNPEDFFRHLFKTIWTEKQLDRLPDFYDFRVDATWPAKHVFYGTDELGAHLAQLFEAFPDCVASVDHVADIPYLGDARDVAIRWTMTGTHTGRTDLYGEPSGQPVFLLAVSHYRIIRGRIRESWTIWDDIAFRRQLWGARLRAA